jgi:hypothetical protein
MPRMNLHYIKAAIEAATGVKLTIDEVKSYLYTEQLATLGDLEKYTFKGYDQYYGYVATQQVVDLVKLADDLEEARVK